MNLNMVSDSIHMSNPIQTKIGPIETGPTQKLVLPIHAQYI